MANEPDPASLTDEELDKLIAGEELPEETPTPEETPPTPPEEEPKPKAEEGAEEEEVPTPPETPPVVDEEEEKPPSRREQLRIQQLLEKYKEPSKRETAPSKPDPEALNYDELEADPALIERLKADRERASSASYERAIQAQESSEWRTLLHVDSPAVEAKYEILNPKDTENFHPAIASALTDQYLNLVGYDAETKLVTKPGIRWSDYVESQMELAEEIAATKIAEARTTVTRQAAQTGIRPDGSTTTKLNLNQAPEAMTDEELDAIIAQAIPSR